MGASITSASLSSERGFFTPAWLPPGGHGNGLDAPAWAPIADFAPQLADRVLVVLAEHGVPGYAAAHRAGPRSRPCSCWRLWVATGAYTRAQDVLVAHLPRLLRDRGAQ